jgi:hypothetical protein
MIKYKLASLAPSQEQKPERVGYLVHIYEKRTLGFEHIRIYHGFLNVKGQEIAQFCLGEKKHNGYIQLPTVFKSKAEANKVIAFKKGSDKAFKSMRSYELVPISLD